MFSFSRNFTKNYFLVKNKFLNNNFIGTFSTMTQSDILQTESITKLLRGQFPEESGDVVNVEDISGGCGAMFRVRVESTQFEGMPKVKQHKLINEVLKKEIKEMHGIVIETKTLEKK